jgi:hypothetical protein
MSEPDTNTNRIKHLEFIQATVNRLAGNSFLIKGWTITLVAALFALAAKEAQQRYVIVALLPALCFWGLDAYYLRQERSYRELYDHASPAESTVPMYSMDATPFARNVSGWWATLASRVLLFFYGPIVLAIILVPLLPAVL